MDKQLRHKIGSNNPLGGGERPRRVKLDMLVVEDAERRNESTSNELLHELMIFSMQLNMSPGTIFSLPALMLLPGEKCARHFTCVALALAVQRISPAAPSLRCTQNLQSHLFPVILNWCNYVSKEFYAERAETNHQQKFSTRTLLAQVKMFRLQTITLYLTMNQNHLTLWTWFQNERKKIEQQEGRRPSLPGTEIRHLGSPHWMFLPASHQVHHQNQQ